MKKVSLILCLVMVLSLIPLSAFAEAEVPVPSETRKREVVILREDVSHEEALRDATYDAVAFVNSRQSSSTREGAYWKVWGEEGPSVYDQTGGYFKSKPIGYSEHRSSSGTLLYTYHYTRTYVSYLGDMRGDSGRVWGTGTVKATGTYLMDEVWLWGTHTVKYGTES